MVWPHSSKYILVVRNTWDKYFYFPLGFPKHISVRDWLGKWIENIWSKCVRPYSIQELGRVLFLSVGPYCCISVESVIASLPHFYLCGCQVVAMIFIVTLCHYGPWVSCDVWSLFSDPEIKMAKISYMAHTVLLTCSVVLREIYRLKCCFLTCLLLPGLVRVHMDWAKGCSFLSKLSKKAAAKS